MALASVSLSLVVGGQNAAFAENQPPVGIERSVDIPVNKAAGFTLTGTDADGDPLTYIIVTLPTHGTLAEGLHVIQNSELPYSLSNGGNYVIYKPTTGYEGSDTFFFVVNDGQASSAPAGYYIKTVGWLTEIPAITPDRWLNPPPLPAPRAITRDDYYDFIRQYYLNRAASNYAVAGDPNAPYQQEYAMYEAFFYHVLHQEAYAQMAMQFLRGSNAYLTVGPGQGQAVRFDAAIAPTQAYLWIKDSPTLTVDDHAFVRQYLLMLESRQSPFEYGAVTLAMAPATSRRMLSLLYPGDAGEAARHAYWQTVWNDWWTLRDAFENSINYNSQWWSLVDAWLTATGEDQVYLDAQMQALVERFFAQASPIGMLPEYGETSGQNTGPGKWISLMEKWATVYRDGRFKWTAHRLFEWTTDRIANMDEWGNIRLTMMSDLMAGYLAADDTVAEVQPASSSALTSRHAVRWCDDAERAATGYAAVLLPQTIPDKLVLRSGWNAADMYAIVELAPPLGHGHIDTAAINCMTSNGSLLLSNEPYFVSDHGYHNSFQLQEVGILGGPWPNMETSVPVMADGQLATYAQVRVNQYMYAPATLDRRIFFVKNKFMWVHDTLTANDSFTADVGPAWQTVSTYGPSGANWMNTCLTTLPVAPVWGWYYLMQWENHPWDLLVTFLPDAQAYFQFDDVTYAIGVAGVYPVTVLNTMKQRIWYKKSLLMAANTSLHFSSLLVPHAPEPDSTARAASFTPVIDTPDVTVMRFRESITSNYYLGINESGAPVDIGLFTTDARRFLVKRYSNAITEYWLLDATTLTSGSTLVFHSPQRRTVELAAGNTCQIAGGSTADCNLNSVPDECEPDTDADGVIDACDLCPTTPAGNPPGLQGCPPAPIITKWEIAVTHGSGVGKVYSQINNGYVEPRTSGVKELRVTFDRALDPATVPVGQIAVTGVTHGNVSAQVSATTLNAGSTSVTINFSPALPNADTYNVTIGTAVKSTAGVVLSGDRSRCLSALAGDANGDKTVTTGDLLAVKARIGQAVVTPTARYDVNMDGGISTGDLLAVNARNGQNAPNCP